MPARDVVTSSGPSLLWGGGEGRGGEGCEKCNLECPRLKVTFNKPPPIGGECIVQSLVMSFACDSSRNGSRERSYDVV